MTVPPRRQTVEDRHAGSGTPRHQHFVDDITVQIDMHERSWIPEAGSIAEAHPYRLFLRALADSPCALLTILATPVRAQLTTVPTAPRTRRASISIRAPLAEMRISARSSHRAAHDAPPRVCSRCTDSARAPRFSDLPRCGGAAVWASNSALSVSALGVSVCKSEDGSVLRKPI